MSLLSIANRKYSYNNEHVRLFHRKFGLMSYDFMTMKWRHGAPPPLATSLNEVLVFDTRMSKIILDTLYEHLYKAHSLRVPRRRLSHGLYFVNYVLCNCVGDVQPADFSFFRL